jgi:hypothetical protein
MDRNKKTAVFGIYPSLEAANNATDVLVKGGFPSSDISALLPDNLGSRPIATEKSTKAPEGAAAGGGSGAVVGGAIGLLAGIGALAIPDFLHLKSKGGNMLLLIIILALLFAGGGGYYGYSRWDAGGGLGIVGTVIVIVLVLYLLGAVR